MEGLPSPQPAGAGPVLSAKGPAPCRVALATGVAARGMPSVEAKGVAGMTRANRALWRCGAMRA